MVVSNCKEAIAKDSEYGLSTAYGDLECAEDSNTSETPVDKGYYTMRSKMMTKYFQKPNEFSKDHELN